MLSISKTLFTLLVLLRGSQTVLGFAAPPLYGTTTQRSSRPLFFASGKVSDRFFQLEELEDRESATTEVFLRGEGTIIVYETDGPIFKDARGFWEEDTNGSLTMIIRRRYEAGNEANEFTDLGTFEFEVERVYRGQLTQVGETVAVSGSIHDEDEVLGDREVGFFNLIETTEARLGQQDGGIAPGGPARSTAW